MRYTHTLLFTCPECNLPVSVSRISHAKNLEDIEGRLVRIKCGYCEKTSDFIGTTAKTHWVSDWEGPSSIGKGRMFHRGLLKRVRGFQTMPLCMPSTCFG
jgi:hypothetical protein